MVLVWFVLYLDKNKVRFILYVVIYCIWIKCLNVKIKIIVRKVRRI